MPIERRDRGSVVIGWLVKLAAVLTLLGIVGFDAVAVAVAHLNGSDDANSAASSAAASWQQNHSAQTAFQAAVDATGHGEVVDPSSFSIDTDGTVHLTLTRHATTLLLYRIGPLKKYATVVVKGEAPPPTL
jgi:hypothetical protein